MGESVPAKEDGLNILVMGAGALGSIIGGFMTQAGHRTHLVGRATHMDAIRNSGIEITGIWGDHHVEGIPCYTSCEELPDEKFDVAFICVKSYDTGDAVQTLLPHLSEDTLVVSFQNGLGNIELIADAIGWERAVEARVIFGAWMPAPGKAEVTVMADPSTLGQYESTGNTERIQALAKAMDESGVPTIYSDRIGTLLWAKVAYNCALNPLSALFDVPYGKLLETEETKQIMREIVLELYAVAAALEISLEPPTGPEYITRLFEILIPTTGGHYASMREDLRNHKRTEIDAINGAICRFGSEKGVPTPTNDYLTRLIKAKEQYNLFAKNA
jgi:2-dehydropantoate 2-reductase